VPRTGEGVRPRGVGEIGLQRDGPEFLGQRHRFFEPARGEGHRILARKRENLPPYRRGGRAHAHQFGVPSYATRLSRLRKGKIVHKIAPAVPPQVKWCPGHEFRSIPERQMERGPAVVDVDAPRTFQPVEPAPLEDGGGVVAGQGLPRGFGNVGHAAVNAGGQAHRANIMPPGKEGKSELATRPAGV